MPTYYICAVLSAIGKETHLSVWERFFNKLSSFIRSINRHRSIANQDFFEYAADHLEMCTVIVSALLHHLQSTTPTDETVGAQYSAHLSELLECLRSMYTNGRTISTIIN